MNTGNNNNNNNGGNGRDGASSTPSGNSSGGRSGGGRRRHFSARGGGPPGRGNGGGRGPSSDANAKPAAAKKAPEENSIEEKIRLMSDQDVLIAFGPHVRSGDSEASRVHQEYLSNKSQRDFIKNARKFLVEHESKPKTKVPENNSDGSVAKEVADSYNKPVTQADRNISDKKAVSVSPSAPRPPPGLQAPMQSVGMEDRKDSSINNNPPRLPPGMGYPPPGMASLPPQQRVTPNPSQNRPGPPPGMPAPIRTPTVGTASPLPKNPTSSILPARTPPPPAAAAAKSANNAPATTPAKPVKVRRTQTRCEQQPGRLFANEMPAAAFNSAPEPSLTARPRSELTARWVLPLPYLRNRALRRFEAQKAVHGAPPQNLTIRDALDNLAVGLFRRGAMDSGSQSSIVSKEILGSSDSAGKTGRPSEDYFFNVDQRTDSVFGTVPFYAPRTPGNVAFRLYYEDEPHVTLATGPCIHVIPADGDVDSVLRFILSNFKSKKTNGISSMNSLASVLELFSPRQNERFFDGAGRVAWGCICESRKVVEQAGYTYIKKKKDLEDRLVAESIKEELPDLNSLGIDVGHESSACKIDVTHDEEEKEKEKNASSETKAKWSLEEYSNERKWRDMQLVYASVLKAAVSNDASYVLLKRDLLSKIQLEYELWCPMTEAFAPNIYASKKGSKPGPGLPGDVSAFPNPVGKDHVKKCQESRNNMQEQVLGFIPQSRQVLPSAKGYQWKKAGRNFFKELSSAMSEIYHDEYAVSDKVWKRRERVRATIESIVSTSGEFPVGTKVAVFGSSANGFGSPNSDLDLCLQVPPSATGFTKENGVEAMTNLATKFTDAGLTDVDTVRLTARIPIVKFNVPYSDDGEEILVECDLSLQNPLACLNTSLLHAYSKISPTACVLASIIKRWAKNRDINNPSQHTLSSYGYVIMLISFLTSRDFNKKGHVSDVGNEPNPILPNLQLVDPSWAQNPVGPYREIPAKPRNQDTMMQHPTEPNYYVNSYFYRSGLEGLQRFCSENHDAETSLGALLASFFHYFAYDFDYKKHVVSLSTKHSSHPMEREIKAEEDGWSLFRQGLAIEDPFELFYDVAHVVRAPNFQHIRKEFSLAYTKIVDAAYTKGDLPTGREIIDLICEPVSDDQSSA